MATVTKTLRKILNNKAAGSLEFYFFVLFLTYTFKLLLSRKRWFNGILIFDPPIKKFSIFLLLRKADCVRAPHGWKRGAGVFLFKLLYQS